MRTRLGALTGLALAAAALLIAVWVALGSFESRLTGSADSANTLVVARNLLERGRFEVDYLGYYFYEWPSVTHPEDSFPLLQPLLVAGLSWPFGDVFAGGALYAGIVVFALLGGIPLLVLRDRGPVAAATTFAVLIAFEGKWTTLPRHTNDGGAAALVGLGWVLLMTPHAARPATTRDARFLGACALFALGAAHKTSAGFVALAALAFVISDAALHVRARLARAGAILSFVALAQLPSWVWAYRHLGELGAPQNALGRVFVRTIAHRDDYLQAWEAFRTYWPAHPERVGRPEPGLREAWLRAWQALVQAVPHYLPLPWLAALVSQVRGTAGSRLAVGALQATALALLLPLYSHFEQRYFLPLRPLIAVALGVAVAEAAEVARLPRWCTSAGPLLLVAASFVPAPRLWRVAHGIGVGVALAAAAATGLRRRSVVEVRAAFVLAAVVVPAVLAAGGSRSTLLAGWRPPHERHEPAARLIERETSPDEVIMSRRVWNLNLHTRRPGVMVPFDPEDVCLVALRYGATALVVDDVDASRLTALHELIEALPVRAREGSVTIYDLGCGRPTRAG